MSDKKLTKSNHNRLLTGTLAGIAEYFGISARAVRIAYLIMSVLTIHFLLGLWIYIVLVVLIPSQTINDGFSNLWGRMGDFGNNSNDDRRNRKILHNVEEKDDHKS